MSRDVLTVGSNMRIPLLYRGEYSQWTERFMNYLEEQTDREAMINSINNGDQPLPRVTQVSITGTSSTEQPLLKDKSMCNKTAKDLWDTLARHMLGSEYGEQDRKTAVLYEYETFKATEGELLLDTYIRYLQVINDLKKCGYSKDNYELNFKFLNNLQPEWKQYATMMRQNKNLMDINIDALYNILKQNQGDPTNNNLRTSSTSQSANKKQEFVKNDNKKVKKKDDEKKRDMSRVKCYNCKKERNFAKDCKKVKVKDYEYYKTKMLLAKKDKDEQVFLAEDQAWMESSSDSDQEINENMVFMAEIKKVISDLEASLSFTDEKISEAEGSETLEQTFNRLQAIVSLEFMDVEIEQDDLNQKFLTSLAPEWLMYTIVWRNRDDLDTMSLDDVYNHLKVYEPEVQKKSKSNSQNMAFISLSNTSSVKGKVHTASVPTASIQVSTASTNVAAASLSHDTVCAYIASQSNGSQIKYEDIT
nr:hypothetical protein [Tanacetum cinerariifolium]